MFDNKMIVDESLQAIDGGFRILAKLPYYRGLGLSMVEDIAVSIDGNSMPRNSIIFSVRGNEWTLDEMEVEYGDRWNFGEQAEIKIRHSEPLKTGNHEVSLAIRMRVSYLPFTPTTAYTKTMTLGV